MFYFHICCDECGVLCSVEPDRPLLRRHPRGGVDAGHDGEPALCRPGGRHQLQLGKYSALFCAVLCFIELGVEVTHHNVWEVATEQDWLDCANFPDGATVPEDGPLAWEVTCVACRVVGALVCRCRPRRAWCTWCAGWAPTAASATRSWR